MSKGANNIIEGWDAEIRGFYQLGSGIDSKDSQNLVFRSGHELEVLFRQLYSRIKGNFPGGTHGRGITKSNWGLRSETEYSPLNSSDETKLERQIALVGWNQRKLGDRPGDLGRWYNQMPTSSNYVGKNSNTRTAIDLVYEYESGRRYAFVELKVDTDSGGPASATFELLSYAFLYLFTRTNEELRVRFQEKEKPVLKASEITLIVLAPKGYYVKSKIPPQELKTFEASINATIMRFASGRVPNLSMTFEFRQFSDRVLDDIESWRGFDPAPFGEALEA